MYRCVNEACGRGFPRQVNFCPFCGTRQGGASSARATQPAAPASKPSPVPQPPAAQNAAPAQPSSRPQFRQTPAAPKAEESLVPTPEQAAAAKARLDQLRGAQSPGGASAPRQPAGGGQHGKPPLREPIGLTTWLLVAMILAVIWYLAKPAGKDDILDKHADQVVVLAGECKLEAARAEVAAMRAAKASDLQLKKANETIASAASSCERARLRAKAWTDLKPALETAVQSGAVERADARLAAFTKKWGADDNTREWDKRIDVKKADRLLDDADACLKRSDSTCLEAKLVAAEKLQRSEVADRIAKLREALSKLLEATVLEQKAPPALGNEPPRPAPQVLSTAPQVPQAALQARKILADAERELNQGNYKSAMDKAEICATMIDVGNRECLGLKQRAERMNREMLRCVASGADWINDKCQ